MTWRAELDAALAVDAPIGVADGAIPVVMCAWRRPERLHRTIAMLQRQRDAPPIELVVWNNHAPNRLRCRAEVDAVGVGGALASVRLLHARHNIAGIARFVVIRRMLAAGYRGPVVMIDDDMDLGERFVADLLEAHAPRSVRGVWAFRMREGYWDREDATVTGAAADYVGTGGSIVDPAFVEHEGFFDLLPDRFGCNEDIWMSRWVAARGWTLAKVATSFSFAIDDRHQGRLVDDRKDELWRIADRLVAGERVAVEPDAAGGAATVPAGEAVRSVARGLMQRLGLGRAVRVLRGR